MELAGKELEEALLSYCKNATAVADPAMLANDASFDKGIGGTKEDHIKEKVNPLSKVLLVSLSR